MKYSLPFVVDARCRDNSRTCLAGKAMNREKIWGWKKGHVAREEPKNKVPMIDKEQPFMV